MGKRVTKTDVAPAPETIAEPARSPDAPWVASGDQTSPSDLTPPTMLPIPAAIQATPPVIDPRDVEIRALRAALEEIADPLKVWQDRARAAGRSLPAIHFPRSHNSDVLKAIARRALGLEV